LREAVDERDDPAEAEAEQAANDLPPPGAFGHEVEDAPPDSDHAHQEEEITPPLDRLPDAVAERLIVAPEDAAPGRLREGRVGNRNEDEGRSHAEDECGLDGADEGRESNQAVADARDGRADRQFLVESVSVNAQTGPFA
jgi:hypothetical protein